MKAPRTPKVKKDPKSPAGLGGQKLFQLPYKRKISQSLGKTTPVGPPVPARQMPTIKYEAQKKTIKNFKGK